MMNPVVEVVVTTDLTMNPMVEETETVEAAAMMRSHYSLDPMVVVMMMILNRMENPTVIRYPS